MSLWKIAWRSIQQRGFASLLTGFSMALGVMLVVTVLAGHGVIHQSFRTNASIGYNMIVGPTKGSKLDLTLNTVYYLSAPLETIPYEYYLEFKSRDERDKFVDNSVRAGADEIRQEAVALQTLTSLGGDLGPWTSLIAQQAFEIARPRTLDARRDGKFSQFTKRVIPVCLGDYFGPFRVIGTEPAMFDDQTFGDEGNKKYEFVEGRNFQTWSKEHGFFEAVVGATVARERQVKLGDRIATTHGDPEGHGHGTLFTVVGILKPTGTPNDRAAFINIEGFYLMESHSKPLERAKPQPGEESAETNAGGADDEARQRAEAEANRASIGQTERAEEHEHPEHLRDPLPLEHREVSAMLVQTMSPIVAPALENVINEGQVAQAALPVGEIFGLFEIIVRPIQTALLGLTIVICVVSGISILVSIYNSMNDRRHEIAVMRALGASRGTVFAIILFESIFLSLGGGLFGWIGGHTLNALASAKIEQVTGVSLSFFDFAPAVNVLELLGQEPTIEWLAISTELLLVPGLILLAVIVGFLPAFSAYRTDVSRSLGT